MEVTTGFWGQLFSPGGTTFVLIIGMALAVGVATLRESAKKSAQEEKEREAARYKDLKSEIERPDDLMVQNFRVLNSFYSESLTQYRRSAQATLFVSFLGFITIVLGAAMGLFWNQHLLGALSGIAGVLGEAAAVLFFKQLTVFQAQMQDSKDKLVATQYLMSSIAISRELLDSNQRPAEVQKINDHLRTLMLQLHNRPKAGGTTQ